MKLYILYGFGIVSSIAGMSYLAAEYVAYLTDWWKLAALLLVIGTFAFLGRYLEEIGW